MTPYNEHIRLAQAMLHGHLYIDSAPSWMEHITIGGHDYILHPPLSAFVCLPFAICGITDQATICEILALTSVALVWKLTHEWWLVAMFALGTTFTYEATNGASWNFALVTSTPFTFGALIYATAGKATIHSIPNNTHHNVDNGVCSPFLVGLFAGLAALARYDLCLAWPVYLWVCRKNWNWVTLLPGFALATLIYVWFNEARFGTLTDGSVSEWYWHYDTFRQQRPYGPFSLHYIPFNIYTLAFMAPTFQWRFPWIRPQFMGQALLSLSPGFLAAQFGPWLMAAMLVSLPALTVYASGFSQLGCRYYVQIFPFLIMTMMDRTVGAEAHYVTRVSGRAKVLIIASIVLSQYFTIVTWVYGLN